MNVPPIEEMTHLKERLGKARVYIIRYARRANTEKEPRSTNIENTVIRQMQDVKPNTPMCRVNDLVSAAAHLDIHQSQPLHINRLLSILQCIQMINTREIIKMTGLEKRQAQKYLRAAKFIIPHLHSHFNPATDLTCNHSQLTTEPIQH